MSFFKLYDDVSFDLVGVTFSGRQKDLKYLAENHQHTATIEEYKYKGEPALKVMVGLYEAGNIPAKYVRSVMRLLPYLHHAKLDIGEFEYETL